jgi:vitamin B12/bleomycin/antimicrobial peptide transport system ATP-binding/permease protein
VVTESSETEESKESKRFDGKAWGRFYSIAKLYFFSEKKRQAWSLLLLLALFSITNNGLNVLMNYVGRDFMTALSLKEKDDFFHQLYLYLGAFCLATPIVVFYRYTEERLGLYWRQWLSLKLLSLYFSNRAYYKINLERIIDNPDQRIEEDIRTFTTLSLSFLLIIFNSIITLVSFMGILWSISFPLTLAAVGYAVVGSIATYYLGRPLISLNFSQLKKEADYRYKLISIRDHAESIAFYRGERKEMIRVRQRLKVALDNLRLIIDWNRNLGFFRTGYNYVIVVLPTVIVAPP